MNFKDIMLSKTNVNLEAYRLYSFFSYNILKMAKLNKGDHISSWQGIGLQGEDKDAEQESFTVGEGIVLCLNCDD